MAKTSLRTTRRRSVDFESLWLITFADLMVQLMAFFAVIYSFSSQGERQLSALVVSMQKAFGVKGAGGTAQGTGLLPGQTGIMPEKATDLEKLLSDLKTADGRDVGTRMRIVTFRGALLFPEGSATVDPVFLPVINRIAQLQAQYSGFQLICEGHAAPGERGRGGVDALELSSERAGAAVRLLIAHGVAPDGIATEGHGDTQPDGKADSAEGRALQRRVRFRFQRLAER